MKQCIHSKEYCKKMMIVFTGYSVLSINSFVCLYLLKGFMVPFFVYVFIAFVTVLFVIGMIKTAFLFTEHVIITDDKITYSSAIKKEKEIKWSEINEIGVGEMITPSGIKHAVFISREILSNEEIDNLYLAKGKIIYFSKISPSLLENIRKHSMVEIPKFVNKWVC